MRWVLSHIWHIVCASIAAALGYFEPISSIVNLMIYAVAADFVIGIWVSLRIGKAIRSKLMWRTLEKLLVCIILVTLSYSAYCELGLFKLHTYVAWGVVGFELWSILESISKVRDTKLFRLLKKIMEVNFERKLGIKIEED